ncbi:cupin domain-containing protein [Sphingomonas psychrotolerans]|uniref:Cupin domain-containing protein n=1 Tax=Sphingomonas psychrotolerans TaxID=1327635 RepID=A0A2K8MI25_9SPHN|nr:cupin domain-containing protein [Sphingomonas psychrotolerans]ATY30821.1 cupin domain-containing protein [Sphingomonas psychrotolerans]
MRVTPRDAIIVGIAALSGWAIAASAQTAPAKLGPAVFDWARMEAKTTDVGAIRNLVRQPTATLDELEMHVTTLNPGLASHAPHTHPNEELVIVREGIVEVLNGGTWKRLGPGSVIFNASNSPHALRNVGATPATYHVINWKTPATPAN